MIREKPVAVFTGRQALIENRFLPFVLLPLSSLSSSLTDGDRRATHNADTVPDVRRKARFSRLHLPIGRTGRLTELTAARDRLGSRTLSHYDRPSGLSNDTLGVTSRREYKLA
jgi:hypothetical protein